MDEKTVYVFQELRRELLLARSEEKSETAQHIDKADKNVDELERRWPEQAD